MNLSALTMMSRLMADSDGEVVGSTDAAEVHDVVFEVYDVHLEMLESPA